jgi:choline-sulfatase
MSVYNPRNLQIKWPHVLTGLILGCVLILAACGEPDQPATGNGETVKRAGPNLLLITLDTARADRFGCYGYEKAVTPNIDRLAGGGVLFEEAFTPVPLTVSSHASIFTGCYPPHHGVHTNDEKLLDEPNLCLAEMLKSRGYRTAAFPGAAVLHRNSGIAQGFETYADDFSAISKTGGAAYQEKPAEAVVRPAIRWLEQQGDTPFFLWVHLFDPHRPYGAPPAFVSRSSGDPYDAEITYCDHWIGELLTSLRLAGLSDDTVVAFLSDHGEGLGEHGESSHGFFIYDSTLRVPLILSAPQLLPRGRRIGSLVRTVDLAPTLLDLLGVPVPQGLHGTSLRPLIDGGPDDPRELYAETYYPATAYGWSPLLGLRTAEHKAILAPRPEFFLLQEDGRETVNRYGDRPGEAARMLSRLEARMVEFDREEVRQTQLLDEQGREMLRALGYLTRGEAPTTKEDEPLPDPKDRISVVTRLEQALDLMGQGRHADAIKILEELAVEEPESGNIYRQLGEALLASHHFARAANIYRRLCRLTPNDPIPLVNLGSLAFMDKEYEKAAGYFERAVEISPHQVEALLNLGYIHQRVLGNRKKAREYYSRFLEAAPNDPQAARIRSILNQI